MPRIHQSRPAAAVTDIDGLCNAAKLVDKEKPPSNKSLSMRRWILVTMLGRGSAVIVLGFFHFKLEKHETRRGNTSLSWPNDGCVKDVQYTGA